MLTLGSRSRGRAMAWGSLGAWRVWPDGRCRAGERRWPTCCEAQAHRPVCVARARDHAAALGHQARRKAAEPAQRSSATKPGGRTSSNPPSLATTHGVPSRFSPRQRCSARASSSRARKHSTGVRPISPACARAGETPGTAASRRAATPPPSRGRSHDRCANAHQAPPARRRDCWQRGRRQAARPSQLGRSRQPGNATRERERSDEARPSHPTIGPTSCRGKRQARQGARGGRGCSRSAPLRAAPPRSPRPSRDRGARSNPPAPAHAPR